VLPDAAGNLIWACDARGIEVTRTFDALNRPLGESTHDSTGIKLRRQWHYVRYDQHAADFAAHQASNLFGRVHEERDADGLRFYEYDWRGLVIKTSHRFWAQQDSAGRAWDDTASQLWTEGADWDREIPAADRDSSPAYLELPGLSDPTTLAIETAYDATGRPIEVSYPEGLRSRNTYNAAGLLEKVEVDRGTGRGYQVVVEALGYNARGQLAYVKHGNGVETTREYDRDLERLTRIFTRRVNNSRTGFQDLTYAYDPVGNPMQIVDNLSRSSFSHNQVIPNTRTFAYDPRYRLIRATGKKHRTVRRKDADLLVTSPDPNDYEPYAITYDYDAVGNFTRNQEYTGGELHYKSGPLDLFNGDRDEAGSFGGPGEGNFRYDANGNTLHTPRHEQLAYTHDNQVRYVNLKGGGQVRYFRHGDQRVVRLVKKNGITALGVYLGPFEYHLRKAVSGYTKLVLQLQGHGRHAQAERVLVGSDPDSLPMFFHHSDHLRSAHVLTKGDGDLLSQEEYFAYGRPSDRRDARNRYRFIGEERDDVTLLCMTGPRTYDPVSGRFLQGDPLVSLQAFKPEGRQTDDNQNNRQSNSSPGSGTTAITPYHYGENRPLVLADPSGWDTIVIVTYGQIWDEVVGDAHVGLFVENNGQGNPVLYDPAGSYVPKDGRNEYDTFIGQEFNLDNYLAWQAQGGFEVHMYYFQTSPQEEKQIAQRIARLGGQDPYRCSISVKQAIEGIGPFKNLDDQLGGFLGLIDVLEGVRPSKLDAAMERLKRGQSNTCLNYIMSWKESFDEWWYSTSPYPGTSRTPAPPSGTVLEFK